MEIIPIDIGINAPKTLLIFSIILSSVPLLVWMERWTAAFLGADKRCDKEWILDIKLGGYICTMIDFIRLFAGAEFSRKDSRKTLCGLAGVLSFLVAILAIAPVPFSANISIDQFNLVPEIASIESGLIYSMVMLFLCSAPIFISSFVNSGGDFHEESFSQAAYLAGYHAVAVLAAISTMIFAGTSGLSKIVAMQGDFPGDWFFAKQPLAFLAFAFSMVAINFERIKSSARPNTHMALISASEYVKLFAWALLFCTVFLGGWQVPFASSELMIEYKKQIFSIGCPVLGVVFIFLGAGIAEKNKKVHLDLRDIEPFLAGLPLALIGAFLLVVSMWFNHFGLPESILDVFVAVILAVVLMIKSLSVCFLAMLIRWKWKAAWEKCFYGYGLAASFGAGMLSVIVTILLME